MTKKVSGRKSEGWSGNAVYNAVLNLKENQIISGQKKKEEEVLCDHRTWKKIAAGRARKIMYHAGRLEWIF